MFTDTRKNVRFKTKVIMQHQVSEATKCLIQCLNHDKCKAININVQEKKCELLSNSIAENVNNDFVETVVGWSYYGTAKVGSSL